MVYLNKFFESGYGRFVIFPFQIQYAKIYICLGTPWFQCNSCFIGPHSLVVPFKGSINISQQYVCRYVILCHLHSIFKIFQSAVVIALFNIQGGYLYIEGREFRIKFNSHFIFFYSAIYISLVCKKLGNRKVVIGIPDLFGGNNRLVCCRTDR